MNINDISKKRIEFQKGVQNNIEGSTIGDYIPESDLIAKASSKPSNPNLVLTHIIDKNGHHRVIWKLPTEVGGDESETHALVAPGQKVDIDGVTHTVNRVKTDGYVSVTDANGRKSDKSLNKMDFHHPLTGEAASGKFSTNYKATEKPTKAAPKKEDKIEPTAEAPKAEESEEGETEKERSDRYEIEGTPAERMEDWVKLIKNFADDKSKNLTVAYGTGGVGKTFNVLKNDKIKAGLESGEYVKFTGGTTAAGFFEMLYNNKDKKIILDDFDMIFKDPGMLGLLATLSRSSSERILTNPASGTGGDVPSRFKFEGKLMVISNIDLEKEAAAGKGNAQKYQELMVNANKVDLKMSKRETWDLINNFILHKDGAVNMDLNFQDAYGSKKEVSKEDREELSAYFKANWKEMKELSGRTLTKANAIQQYYKDNGADWTKKVDQMLLENAGTDISVDERFKDFNDSIDMVAQGQLKSAVIVANNSNQVVEALKDKGFYNSNVNERGFDLQKQMNPDYIPEAGEKFVTESYVTVTGANISERKLYETLWEHNGKVIIFDKSAKSFLKSDLGQGLLKGALDTSGDGELAWLSKTNTGKFPVPAKDSEMDNVQYTSELAQKGFIFDSLEDGTVDKSTITHPFDIPKKFNFKGRCIFITDSASDAPQPIQSRSMIADIDVNPGEFLQLAESIISRRTTLGHQFSGVFKDVSPVEYRNAVDFLRRNEGKIADKHFDEEGVQTIISHFRSAEKGESPEKTERSLRRTLQKSLILDGFEADEDIMKAFNSLI